MKKILLLINLILFLILPISVLAITEKENLVKVEPDETLNYNLVKFANEIVIDGKVEGDVIVAGTNVTINGPVSGDVIAAANQIKINSEVAGNIRVVAFNVEIDGKIGKNVNLFASNITIGEQAEIDGDLTSWGDKIELLGKVRGDVDGNGKNLVLANEIGGNVNLKIESGGNLKLTDKTIINGNLTYKAAQQFQFPAGAQIKGEVNYLILETRGANKFLSAAYWFGKVISFFGLLLLAVIILSLWPDKLKKFSRLAVENPSSNFLKGVFLLLATPLVIIGLFLSVIGIPLAIIILAFYLLIIYLSKIVLAVWLAERFLPMIKSAIVSLSLGLLFIVVVIGLPYIGGLLNLIIVCLVLGGLGKNFRELLKIDQKK